MTLKTIGCRIGQIVVLAGLPIGIANAATIIGVDFGSNGVATGPAVIGSGGDKWNILTANTGSGITLKDTTGASTSVLLTYTAQGSFGRDTDPNLINPNLMEDYIFAAEGPTTISFSLSGLTPNAIYDLYSYNGGDPSHSTQPARQANITANGVTLFETSNSLLTNFVNGQNYVAFFGLQANGSGVIQVVVARDASNVDQEVDLDGFQLQSPGTPSTVPEPSAAILLVTGIGALVLHRRRRVAS